MPPTVTRRRELKVIFDRSFGVLAVHHPTGLILVAGRVTEGLPLPTVPQPWS